MIDSIIAYMETLPMWMQLIGFVVLLIIPAIFFSALIVAIVYRVVRYGIKLKASVGKINGEVDLTDDDDKPDEVKP